MPSPEPTRGAISLTARASPSTAATRASKATTPVRGEGHLGRPEAGRAGDTGNRPSQRQPQPRHRDHHVSLPLQLPLPRPVPRLRSRPRPRLQAHRRSRPPRPAEAPSPAHPRRVRESCATATARRDRSDSPASTIGPTRHQRACVSRHTQTTGCVHHAEKRGVEQPTRDANSHARPSPTTRSSHGIPPILIGHSRGWFPRSTHWRPRVNEVAPLRAASDDGWHPRMPSSSAHTRHADLTLANRSSPRRTHLAAPSTFPARCQCRSQCLCLSRGHGLTPSQRFPAAELLYSALPESRHTGLTGIHCVPSVRPQ